MTGKDEPVSRRASWRKVLPGLAVSAGSLALLLYLVDFKRLVEALSLADYRLVLAVSGLTVIWLLIRAMVWRILLQGKAAFNDVFFSLNAGYLLNNLLPFRLGELGRAYLLGNKARVDFWRVLPTIVVERALDLAFALGLLFGSLPFVIGADWARQAAVGVGIFFLIAFAALFILAGKHQMTLSLLERLASRWPRLQAASMQIANSFLDGLVVLRDARRFGLALVWMVVNWLVGIGQYYLIVRAFFPQGELLWAAFTLGVAALGVAAPSSPAAVGVLELAVVGALSVFHLSPAVALALAFTLHINQILVTGIFGIYALGRGGESLSALYHHLRNIRRVPR